MFQSEEAYNEQFSSTNFSNESMRDNEDDREYEALIDDNPLTPLEQYWFTYVDRLNTSNKLGLQLHVTRMQADMLNPEHADKLNVIARLIECARIKYVKGTRVQYTNVCTRCGNNRHMYMLCNPNSGLCFRCNGSGREPKIQLA